MNSLRLALQCPGLHGMGHKLCQIPVHKLKEWTMVSQIITIIDFQYNFSTLLGLHQVAYTLVFNTSGPEL